MIVQILEDVFNNSKDDAQLDKLWNAIEGPHSLYLKDDPAIDTLMNSSWYSELRHSSKDVIYGIIVKMLQTAKSIKPKIKVSNTDTDQFSIEEAIRYLNQPFILVLENSNKDSNFFDALLISFKKKGKMISNYKKNGWFVYGMGGGSTIPDMLESKMNEFRGDIFKKEPKNYLRCFVLIDSDKHFPSDDINNGLIDFLEKIDVPFHILEKREMENYLPDDVFSEITDNREFIDTFLNLTPLQRDYFDLEKGFEKRLTQLKEGVQDLYNTIQEKDFNVLRKQSLKDINGKKNNFKSDFPKLFLSKKVNQENLLARCTHHTNDPQMHPYNPNELPDLLTEISNLL